MAHCGRKITPFWNEIAWYMSLAPRYLSGSRAHFCGGHPALGPAESNTESLQRPCFTSAAELNCGWLPPAPGASLGRISPAVACPCSPFSSLSSSSEAQPRLSSSAANAHQGKQELGAGRIWNYSDIQKQRGAILPHEVNFSQETVLLVSESHNDSVRLPGHYRFCATKHTSVNPPGCCSRAPCKLQVSPTRHANIFLFWHTQYHLGFSSA